jgi:hypothetical protein
MANKPWDSCSYITADGRAVIATAAGRHDEIQITAQNLIPTIAKDPFCGPVEKYHPVIFINGDKGLVRIFNDSLEDGQNLAFIVAVIHVLIEGF